MNPKSEKPLRLFVNPFAMWADLAVKSGEAVLASTQAAIARANAPKVAVLPSADAPPRKAPLRAKPSQPKAARAKPRKKAKAKRRAKR
jgi:hypothetical protein